MKQQKAWTLYIDLCIARLLGFEVIQHKGLKCVFVVGYKPVFV